MSKDPNEEYNNSYEQMNKKTQGGKLLPGHPNYQKSGYDEYGNYSASRDASSGTGGSSCFPGGTRISTPSGSREIEALNRGDLVWSVSASGSLEAREILRLKVHQSQRIWKLMLAGGEVVQTTAVHSFRSKGRWMQARQLTAGDTICRIGSSGEHEHVVVLSSEKTSEVQVVYNLVVEENFTFLAEGSLVHSFTHLRLLRSLGYRVYRAILRKIACLQKWPATVGKLGAC